MRDSQIFIDYLMLWHFELEKEYRAGARQKDLPTQMDTRPVWRVEDEIMLTSHPHRTIK